MSGEESAPQQAAPDRSAAQRFYGKYKGVVTNNIDPLGDSRLMVLVPAIPHAVAMWAVPCVPYAGLPEGLHIIPMIGANVWVEFEGGDPSYPIWVGYYWETGEMSHRKTVNPAIPALAKILKTLCSELTLNDTPAIGGAKLETLPPAIPIPATLEFDLEGISLTCPPCSITMKPLQGITIQMGPATSIELTLDGITLTAPKITHMAVTNIESTAGAEIKLTAATKAAIQSAGAVDVKGAGQVNIEAAGALNVKSAAAAAVEAGATLDLKGGAMVGIKGAIVNIN